MHIEIARFGQKGGRASPRAANRSESSTNPNAQSGLYRVLVKPLIARIRRRQFWKKESHAEKAMSDRQRSLPALW